MKYIWDPRKARQDHIKHGIHFSELEPVFEDERALQSDEVDRGEVRSILVGIDGQGRILAVAYTMDEDKIRIISARKADKEERAFYGVKQMKKHHDFGKAKRGAVVPAGPGKTRITIRLDNEVLEWFRSKVDAMGGGSYQSMINAVLRDHIRFGGDSLESYLRGIVREEIKAERTETTELTIPPGRL